MSFDSFIEACRENNLYKAKRLVFDINPFACNCKAFIVACESGSLEVAKWLVELGVYVPVSNYAAFYKACKNGRLELAKWLLTLEGVGQNIPVCSTFRLACSSGRLKITEWLLTLEDVDPCAAIVQPDGNP